jgi:DNA gyrase subunit A
MLQAHIDHEKIIYRRGFKFDLRKILARIHIIEGLLKAYDAIDEVIHTIKSSASTAEASIALQKLLEIDATQAKAILDLKLAKLSKLDITKLHEEKNDLEVEGARIKKILDDEQLLNEELIKGWRQVANEFGDERRTKVIQLSEGENNEPVEQKQLSISFTNKDAIFVSETSTLYAQRRNGAGAKFKLDKDEYVVDTLIGENTGTIMFFTSHGNYYHMKASDLVVGEKQYITQYITTLPYEHIVAAAMNCKKKYIIFLTKNGILKKSELSEYNLKKNIGAAAIKLDKEDEIISIMFVDDEQIGIATRSARFIRINTKDINPIGRVTRGVCGIKLNNDDYVVSAKVISKTTTSLISISTDGYIKQTSIDEFMLTGRATKGLKIQSIESLCDFLPITSKEDVLIVSSNSQIRLRVSEIPTLSRNAQGVKSIKLPENSKIIKLLQI